MSPSRPAHPQHRVAAIRARGLSIYDPIAIGDPDLWIPTPELQALLDQGLRGLSLVGLPLRTRSKVIKSRICEVLGYPIPPVFTKVRPRFTGQRFDTYTQKSNNLQVWNEDLLQSRRYVIVQITATDVVKRVKVVSGSTLALFGTTNTLTHKFQARCVPGQQTAELVAKDTERLLPCVAHGINLARVASPTLPPAAGQILPISDLLTRLSTLVGKRFADPGADQERLRGAALHRLVCMALGYAAYADDGQFPDVRHQLLEIKLQTSPTIDLGLVSPASTEPLSVPILRGRPIRHCDVRYAIFRAQVGAGTIELTHCMLTTGVAFLTRFPPFQGKHRNSKRQIRTR